MSLMDYQCPTSEKALLKRLPQLVGVLNLVTALMNAFDAREFDTVQREKVRQLTVGLRTGVGLVNEGIQDQLTVGERIGLIRVARVVREVGLIVPWPFTPSAVDGDGRRVILTPSAEIALRRLLTYDVIRDAGQPYNHQVIPMLGALEDLQTLTEGVRLSA